METAILGVLVHDYCRIWTILGSLAINRTNAANDDW